MKVLKNVIINKPSFAAWSLALVVLVGMSTGTGYGAAAGAGDYLSDVTEETARNQQLHNFYAVLGVGTDADLTTIKKAYHRLALGWHPDKASSPSTERFKLLNDAYTTLSDETRRESYNAKLRMPGLSGRFSSAGQHYAARGHGGGGSAGHGHEDHGGFGGGGSAYGSSRHGQAGHEAGIFHSLQTLFSELTEIHTYISIFNMCTKGVAEGTRRLDEAKRDPAQRIHINKFLPATLTYIQELPEAVRAKINVHLKEVKVLTTLLRSLEVTRNAPYDPTKDYFKESIYPAIELWRSIVDKDPNCFIIDALDNLKYIADFTSYDPRNGLAATCNIAELFSRRIGGSHNLASSSTRIIRQLNQYKEDKKIADYCFSHTDENTEATVYRLAEYLQEVALLLRGRNTMHFDFSPATRACITSRTSRPNLYELEEMQKKLLKVLPKDDASQFAWRSNMYLRLMDIPENLHRTIIEHSGLDITLRSIPERDTDLIACVSRLGSIDAYVTYLQEQRLKLAAALEIFQAMPQIDRNFRLEPYIHGRQRKIDILTHAAAELDTRIPSEPARYVAAQIAVAKDTAAKAACAKTTEALTNYLTEKRSAIEDDLRKQGGSAHPMYDELSALKQALDRAIRKVERDFAWDVKDIYMQSACRALYDGMITDYLRYKDAEAPMLHGNNVAYRVSTIMLDIFTGMPDAPAYTDIRRDYIATLTATKAAFERRDADERAAHDGSAVETRGYAVEVSKIQNAQRALHGLYAYFTHLEEIISSTSFPAEFAALAEHLSTVTPSTRSMLIRMLTRARDNTDPSSAPIDANKLTSIMQEACTLLKKVVLESRISDELSVINILLEIFNKMPADATYNETRLTCIADLKDLERAQRTPRVATPAAAPRYGGGSSGGGGGGGGGAMPDADDGFTAAVPLSDTKTKASIRATLQDYLDRATTQATIFHKSADNKDKQAATKKATKEIIAELNTFISKNSARIPEGVRSLITDCRNNNVLTQLTNALKLLH